MHTGKSQTERGAKKDMNWTELLKSDNAIMKIKAEVTERFKNIFPSEERSGEIYFSLPDGDNMHIFRFLGNSENIGCLGMDYGEDDGDLYYPEDYPDFETFFADMLAETKR